MTAPDLPRGTHADPRRQPWKGIRVRWTRPEWTVDSYGHTRWRHRWFVTGLPAQRFVRRLLDDGCIVEVDRFLLDYLRSVRFTPEEGEHPA